MDTTQVELPAPEVDHPPHLCQVRWRALVRADIQPAGEVVIELLRGRVEHADGLREQMRALSEDGEPFTRRDPIELLEALGQHPTLIPRSRPGQQPTFFRLPSAL